MTGSDFNFFGNGLVYLLIYLIICGVIANLFGAIYLIGWIVKHVHIN